MADDALTAEARTEIEMDLASAAAQVIAVGLRLSHRLSRDLAVYRERPSRCALTPDSTRSRGPAGRPAPGPDDRPDGGLAAEGRRPRCPGSRPGDGTARS